MRSNNRLIANRFSRSVISAALLLSFLISSAPAASAKDRSRSKPPIVGVNFESVVAESYRTGVRLVWKTGFEKGVAGFRVWREIDGRRTQVGPEMVPGGFSKAGETALQSGDQYAAFDPNGSSGAVYRIEAVDLSNRSTWTGPVAATDAIADDDGVTELIAGAAASKPVPQVDYPAAVSRSETSRDGLFVSEQVDFAAVESAFKIGTRTRGIYRLDAKQLASAGFESIWSGSPRVISGGADTAVEILEDGSIEFFADGIDTAQTEENVFWVGPDTQGAKMMPVTTQGYMQNARDGSTRYVAERRERSMRISSVLNGARENFFGSYVSNTAIDKTFDLRNIAYSANDTATVGIDLQGISNVVHQITVRLNGSVIGNFSFGAYDRRQWTVSVPVALLVEGTNTITLQGTNTTSDFSLTEALRITYPRRLVATEDRLEFIHEGSQTLKLRGFASERVKIYDVTDPGSTSLTIAEGRLEADNTYSVTVPSSGTSRQLFAVGNQAKPLTPVSIVRNSASFLKSQYNGAKLLIIGPADLLEGAVPLKLAREQEGIPTMLVDIEDVYDEFGFGLKSAESLKSFLQFAKQNWATPPDYVIFAGDSSSDPKNLAGYGGHLSNRVPTMFVDTWNIEAPSDEMLVDFNGDAIGEIAVGRLPAANRYEFDRMVEKVLATTPQTRQSVGQRGVVFVSDDPLGYDFAVASRTMGATLPGGVGTTYLDRTGQDPATVRSNIISRINNGAAIVNFFGHGSITSWTSAGLLRNADAPSLVNATQPTLIVSLACLNGDNTVFGVFSFADAMMKRENGGAFAVWAASGWNGAVDEELMGRDLYPRIFAGMRLGDAVREVKSRYQSLDLRRTFIYFGDPTQRLVQP